MKKISVVIPTYNEKADTFDKSLRSILNQTYTNLQIVIIVDNPNNDEIIKYLKQIKDSRVEYYINQKNLGIVKSLNKALDLCNGEYIARMDADDISNVNRLQKQYKYMEENDCDICGTDVIWFNNTNDNIKKVHYPSLSHNIYKQLKYRNCMAHPTFMFKKKVLEKLHYYNEIPLCEDYDFLLRAKKCNYKLYNIPDYLLKYRINDSGLSQKNIGKQMLLSNYIKKIYNSNNKNAEDICVMVKKYIDSKIYLKQIKKYEDFYGAKAKYSTTSNIIDKLLMILMFIKHPIILLKNLFDSFITKIILFLDKIEQ